RPSREAREVAAGGDVVPSGHGRALGRRARDDAVRPPATGLAERDAEALLRHVIEAERNRRAARSLDELSDRWRTARAREIVHEQRAVPVRDVAVRVARGGEA